ncbi:MAG: type II secretion system protein [Candidatus Gastranaerophilales bacterium]|nr:type II secretion system protein [Candidatus Gastranaerophilales bacterium]
MFKKAFTLAEILITMVIISIIALVLIQTLKPQKYYEQTNLANAYKAVEIINQATTQITSSEPTQCPTGTFTYKLPGKTDVEFAILKSSGSSEAEVEDIVALFGNHIKYEADSLNFCDFTGFCNDSDIKGARIAGGIYIGFEKFSEVDDCPDYFTPGEATKISAPQKYNPLTNTQSPVQCWGKVYIDVNGTKGPDTEGQDVFVYGLGEFGIVK